MDHAPLGRPEGRHLATAGRLGRVVLALAVAASAALAGLGRPIDDATAADQVAGIAVALSDSQPTNVEIDVNAIDDALIPDLLIEFPEVTHAYGLGFQGAVNVDTVTWDATATALVEYDDAFLRQGQTLDIQDTLTPGPGSVTFSGDFVGTFGIYQDVDGDPLPPYNWQPYAAADPINKPWSKSAACELRLLGDGSGECTVTAVSLPLVSIPLLPGIVHATAEMSVDLTVNVNPAGVTTVREATFVGANASEIDGLDFDGPSPAVVDDALDIGCSVPTGTELEYGFSSATYDPATDMETHHKFTVRTHDPFDISTYGTTILAENTTFSALDFDMTGTGTSAILGEVAANNIAPVADAGLSVYSGDQGSPITFNGLGSSSTCGFPTLRWDFSDGGVAFGALPQHTFEGSGWYSGLLTATDATGLTNTATFAIDVANLAPVANAGPDTMAAWGQPVAFNGSATDPGADDQPTLEYSWYYGDGIVANGGASSSHAYSLPGVYNATFTATDKHGASDSDSRAVTIRKRDVTAAFLGSNGTFDTAGSLSASLVDEYGAPVAGRTVQFTVDGLNIGHAITDVSGVASLGYTPAVDAGNHAVNVQFVEDALYYGASSNGSIAVAKKATTVMYTGALKGNPNKFVSLSAVLVDATGKALGGRTIDFQLGTQAVSAVTNVNGVATASLKLTQKTGSYPLTATWSPADADAARYVGSAASATFKIGK